MYCLNFLTTVVPILIIVALITLMERKILASSQMRKGPNKPGFIGIVQPLNDAVKLFTNQNIFPEKSNQLLYFMGPIVALGLSLSIWVSYPSASSLSESHALILIYTILSMNVYPLILSGWASNSKYAIIGGLRGISQTISYEISFALTMLFILEVNLSLSIYYGSLSSIFFHKLFIFLPISCMFLITSVAETNRTPFDFAEGESELVSGFNVEYSAALFALIFLAEYASIYFMSLMFSLLFLSNNSNYLSSLVSVWLVFAWVWLRCTLPRFRYDKLMGLAWFSFLPAALFTNMYGVSMIYLTNY